MCGMKNVIALLILIAGWTPLRAEDTAPAKLPPQILTNQGIVMLSDAGYDEDFLLDLIQSRQTRFDTSPEGLSYLSLHGLCEHVVRAMVARANSHDQHAVVAMAAPVEPAGVKMVPLAGTNWIHGAGFPVPPPAAPQFQIVRRRSGLLHHRWYLVEPGQPDQRLTELRR